MAKLNWPNILLHCAVAFPMAAGAGYWPAREILQHGRQWGGLQSTWEWVAPVAVTPFGMAAGWWASWALM